MIATRQLVEVETARYDSDEDEWPFDKERASLLDVSNWFQAQLGAIPDEQRQNTYCRIEAAGREDPFVKIEIGYTRLETDDEFRLRTGLDESQRRSQEAYERRLYEQLKAKFEAS